MPMWTRVCLPLVHSSSTDASSALQLKHHQKLDCNTLAEHSPKMGLRYLSKPMNDFAYDTQVVEWVKWLRSQDLSLLQLQCWTQSEFKVWKVSRIPPIHACSKCHDSSSLQLYWLVVHVSACTPVCSCCLVHRSQVMQHMDGHVYLASFAMQAKFCTCCDYIP